MLGQNIARQESQTEYREKEGGVEERHQPLLWKQEPCGKI